jgi:pimeloyl-ACP methyl ester carboxylesterase
MSIPFFDLGGTGAHLHFLHANGYPPDCYQPLFDVLKTGYHVFGMMLRPLWEDAHPEEIHDWQPFSDDLLHFLSSRPEPVIGVGHSIGAIVTLRAALRDPGRFRALVLIDPVLLRPPRLVLWNIFRALGLSERVHPLIAAAKKRRRTFDDLEAAYRGYRNREVFKYLSDDNLRIYLRGITRMSPRGDYELVYSPEWESRIYYTSLRDFDLWRGLPGLQVPALFLRGAESDTFLEAAARLVKQKQPRAQVETLEKSTHLLPLERPEEVFDRMQSFLKSHALAGAEPLQEHGKA